MLTSRPRRESTGCKTVHFYYTVPPYAKERRLFICNWRPDSLSAPFLDAEFLSRLRLGRQPVDLPGSWNRCASPMLNDFCPSIPALPVAWFSLHNNCEIQVFRITPVFFFRFTHNRSDSILQCFEARWKILARDSLDDVDARDARSRR